MRKKEWQYLLVYPESHGHLGLFEDLKDTSNVRLIEASRKKINSHFLQLIRRFHLGAMINKHVSLPFKQLWYEKVRWDIDSSKKYCVIIVDAAMKILSPKTLNNLFAKQNVRGVLVLLNSMDAGSIAIIENKEKLSRVNWDAVYTFDPEDAKKYSFHNLGCCYYSAHPVDVIQDVYKDIEKSSVYFVGGIKGNREQLIISVFKRLSSASISCNFNIMITGERRFKTNLYDDIIHYYAGRWISYEKVLAGVFHSDIILEVIQEGQSGPSLRYYEAVCYNKRLLTNNPNIESFPYYNERFMRTFMTAEDIDIEWIKREETVEYGYQGEFSPKNMLYVVTGD